MKQAITYRLYFEPLKGDRFVPKTLRLTTSIWRKLHSLELFVFVVLGILLLALAPTPSHVIYADPIAPVVIQPVKQLPLPQTKLQPQDEAVAVEQSPTRVTPVYYNGSVPAILNAIKQCESSGNYANEDTGHNGHYGAYQFSLATWAGVGGTGDPAQASPAEQDMRATILYNQSGTGPWLASIGCWG